MGIFRKHFSFKPVIDSYKSELLHFSMYTPNVALEYTRKNGVFQLRVNGMILTRDAINYIVPNGEVVDSIRLTKFLSGNTHLTPPIIEMMIDGFKPPRPPYRFTRLLSKIRIARFQRNLRRFITEQVGPTIQHMICSR